ncbi:MAG TPA: extracellular solute-binding protein [Acidobacteriaceae bacterium]|jgi:multiple sugar transport system substrate-binding protein|nr:extracellular solute-binding protein [Acidobacteriaceae bacterium]
MKEVSRGSTIHLKGITWNHTRGYLPMVATAQRFSEMNPNVRIAWETRSLQDFADAPIQKLAHTFDLLVIDHPFSGYAATHDVLVPLDECITRKFLEDQARNSVGHSHASYQAGGHQWALAIDAATPISGWRPDLLEQAHASVPKTWSELLKLAKLGMVALPAIAIDSLMNFYMFCGAQGEDPFSKRNKVVTEGIGIRALKMLQELVSLCGSECLYRNPIATWELLSSSDTVAYCPFAYGYSNYSRTGYARHVLQVGGLVEMDSGASLRSTLGGTGLAISSRCQHTDIAAKYVEFVASEKCQRSIYFDSGGQPGQRKAWLDRSINRRNNNFFSATLPTLDAAFLRPTFYGYMHFQDLAGAVVHTYLKNGGKERKVLYDLSRLYTEARKEEQNG